MKGDAPPPRPPRECCAISCEGVGLTVQGSRESIAAVLADGERHRVDEVALLTRDGELVRVAVGAPWKIRSC